MSQFEALYGKGFRIPMNWDSPMNRVVLGTEMLKKMEQEIVKIGHNLKEDKDR